MKRARILPGNLLSCLCAASMLVTNGCSAKAAPDGAVSSQTNDSQSIEIQANPNRVTMMRAPEAGIQPQAVLDGAGTLHLIYFKGKPMAGDIFYVRRGADATAFSTPLRVNSKANSAVAMGWIRGAQLAIGKNGRVHVAWNGSSETEKGPGGNPMLYTRLNDEGTAFEPQRNLITWAGGIDGGGTLAADSVGNVYVFWHAMASAKDEAGRAVFLARSNDEGKTFSRESQVNPEPTGACGCCGMKAMIAADGSLHVLYRAARNNMDRDTILLVSHDKGVKFQSQTLDKWQLMACPLTTYSLSQAAPGTPVFGAWKTKDQVYFAALPSSAKAGFKPIAAPGNGDNRKYPMIATNSAGDVLFAWTEGTAWGRGGSLAWQVFDKDGNAIGDRGRASGVPAWSLLTAIARPDGSFLLIY